MISAYLDYTLLSHTATEAEIISLCNEARKSNLNSICINSCYVKLAKELLLDTDVKICSTVGFPTGSASTESKIFEAKNAINEGAHEIDMVMNLGLLKSKNYISVMKDISSVKKAIGKTILKVNIEISELNKNEIVKASQLCIDANADYIKTSTGFSKSGATFTAVKIIKKTVRDSIQIKASGDITTLEAAQKFIDIGVSRVGLSPNLKLRKALLRLN